MVMIKATNNSEAGVMPSEKLLREMGEFNEERVKAGVMQAGEGLHPNRAGKRADEVDGEALEWAERCPDRRSCCDLLVT